MAEQAGKAVAVDLDPDELMSFGLEMLAERGEEAMTPGDDGPLTLRLSDLLQDPNGEVVLFNDSGVPVVALDAAVAVVDEGQSGPHVTAGGDDVSGFRYVAFDNGLTLYYEHGLDLIVRSEQS